MNRISIEIPEQSFKRLSALAEGAGKPVDLYAAEILVAQLENGGSNWIRHEIAKLREDLAITAQALLVLNSDVDEEEARQWVKEKLLNR